MAGIFHDFFWTAGSEPLNGIAVPDEAAATGAEPEGTFGTAAWTAGRDPESCTAVTGPEPAATARPVSVSRFRRCRSARMSAACW